MLITRQGKQTGKYSQVILILGLTFSALFVVIQAEILRLKCGAYANFTVVQQDSYLPDSFITLHGVEPHYCQYECSLDGRCKSINTNEDELICELHNKSTEDPRDKVQTVPQDGWTYYSTQYNESRVGKYCMSKNPCRKGYKCYDHCDCPGYRCIPMGSCTKWYRHGARKSGIYHITTNENDSIPVYCDFESEANSTWTLVLSFSIRNKSQVSIPFFKDRPISENDPNEKMYRLSRSVMGRIQNESRLWRATCSFRQFKVDYRDYMRGSFNTVNIMTFNGEKKCQRVDYINIRGHSAYNKTVAFWQFGEETIFHTDSSLYWCQFKPQNRSVTDEDNFGHYHVTNPAFRCSSNGNSTTQYWFGNYLGED